MYTHRTTHKSDPHHNKYLVFLFFFNATATTETYTLSLHDALPISQPSRPPLAGPAHVLGRVAVEPRRWLARGWFQRDHGGAQRREQPAQRLTAVNPQIRAQRRALPAAREPLRAARVVHEDRAGACPRASGYDCREQPLEMVAAQEREVCGQHSDPGRRYLLDTPPQRGHRPPAGWLLPHEPQLPARPKPAQLHTLRPNNDHRVRLAGRGDHRRGERAPAHHEARFVGTAKPASAPASQDDGVEMDARLPCHVPQCPSCTWSAANC